MAMTLTTDDINALKGIFATKVDLQHFATKDDLRGFATKSDIEEVIKLLNDVVWLVDDRFDRLEVRTTRIEKHLSRKRRFPQLKLS